MYFLWTTLLTSALFLLGLFFSLSLYDRHKKPVFLYLTFLAVGLYGWSGFYTIANEKIQVNYYNLVYGNVYLIANDPNLRQLHVDNLIRNLSDYKIESDKSVIVFGKLEYCSFEQYKHTLFSIRNMRGILDIEKVKIPKSVIIKVTPPEYTLFIIMYILIIALMGLVYLIFRE